jgi:small subunit ribosomal protein S4
MKLYLKGSRCYGAKCGFTKRPFPPGMVRYRRRKVSDYGIQLQEKQKMKRYYGIFERQFRRIFSAAERMKGSTGENLLSLLERRLDNVVQRLGFASSKSQARQFITHGIVTVNGRKVSVPSYLCKVGDVISVKKTEKAQSLVQAVAGQTKGQLFPSWLEMTEEPLAGRMKALPTREEVPIEINELLVVEYCSK